MNEQRHQINTDNIREAGQPNMLKDLLRGLIADTRGALEGRAMRRQARDAKEQAIADEAYRQRMASVQEKQLAISQQRADHEITQYDDAKKEGERQAIIEQEERERQRILEEEKRKLDEQNKIDYGNAFKESQDAYKEYLNDPTNTDKENRYRSAVRNLKYYGGLIGIDTQSAEDTLSEIDSKKKEQEIKTAQEDISRATDEFNEAYTNFMNLDPGDEEYEAARRKLISTALELHGIKSKLDPNADVEFLEQILNEHRDLEGIGAIREKTPELKKAFTDKYSEYIDNKSTIEDLEKSGANLIHAIASTGGDPKVYDDMLKNARTISTERRDKQEQDAEIIDTAEEIANAKTTVDETTLDTNVKNEIKDLLSIKGMSQKELRGLISDAYVKRGSQKESMDPGVRGAALVNNSPHASNKRFMNPLIENRTGSSGKYMVSRLESIFGEGNVLHIYNPFPEKDEYDQETIDEIEKAKNEAADIFIGSYEPPGGEIVKRSMFALNYLQGNLANLHDEYLKLTEDGTSLKEKLGRVVKTKEGVYQYIAGTTTDSELAGFMNRVNFVLGNYIRVISGAQITEWEHKFVEKLLVSAGNEPELNDAIFKALDDEIKSGFDQYYTKAAGQEWGTFISDKQYNDAHDVADREDPISRMDLRQKKSDWNSISQANKIGQLVEGLRGIENTDDGTTIKYTREELSTFLKNMDVPEDIANDMLDTAEDLLKESVPPEEDE